MKIVNRLRCLIKGHLLYSRPPYDTEIKAGIVETYQWRKECIYCHKIYQ